MKPKALQVQVYPSVDVGSPGLSLASVFCSPGLPSGKVGMPAGATGCIQSTQSIGMMLCVPAVGDTNPSDAVKLGKPRLQSRIEQADRERDDVVLNSKLLPND